MGVISFRFRYSDCLRRKMFQPHDYIMLLHFYDVSTDVPLPDFLSLPSVCQVPNGRHSAKTKTLPSARIWHLGKFETLPNAGRLALGKVAFFGIPLMATFAECFSLCTRQSDQIFFIPFFSIFRYKYNKNISEYRDITGSYYNKYIIDK